MRQGPNSRRSRGRGNGRRQNVPLRHQTFDSNGPDVRIRGNAFQVHEKYLALARDAAASGDRVAAENYLQHAEHYFRIISTFTDANGGEGQGQQGQGRGGRGQRGDNNGNGNGSAGLNGHDADDDDMEDDEGGGGSDDRSPMNA